jgi:predicted site-specific integrase-resolvase
MQDEYVPIRIAAQFTGLHPNTLRKFADNNKVQSYKSPAGQRMFHKQSLQTFCRSTPTCIQVSKDTKQSFIYVRVSSKKQHDDLLRQLTFLQSRKPEYAHYKVIQDVASGINFQRKGLQTILDACLQGTLGEVVVAHRDRLARFGFELIKYIIEHSGGTLTVIDDQKNKSTEQELSEDLMSIVHIYCCKQMGKRKYSTHHESHQNKTENQPGEKESIQPVV